MKGTGGDDERDSRACLSLLRAVPLVYTCYNVFILVLSENYPLFRYHVYYLQCCIALALPSRS